MHSCPITHVEAGLRTWNLDSPYPEEGNRVLIDSIAAICAAPTEAAAANLRSSGIPNERIFVTGNTAIDSLLFIRDQINESDKSLHIKFGDFEVSPQEKVVTITCHRRESFGKGLENICRAIQTIAVENPYLKFVYPVHLNPQVQEPVRRILSTQQNIHLIKPLPYSDFVRLLMRSELVLTDSGGIQEEAPSLDLPVLVMREATERPEGVEAGCSTIVGTSEDSIVDGVRRVLNSDNVRREMANSINPYGDGKAAERILTLLDSGHPS